MLRPITRSVVSPGLRAVNSPVGGDGYSDPVMTVALTTSVGGTSYIYFNADSSTNPNNCLKVKVVQSTGEIALARRVGGSDTSLISVISTLTTPDNITIVVDKASNGASSTVSLFHNGVQKGLTQTINSAGIINNKIHYLAGDFGSSLLKKRRFALGSELVVNGRFDADTAWTKEASWTISNGKAILLRAASDGSLTQTSGTLTTLSKIYHCVYTVSESNGAILRAPWASPIITIPSTNATHTINVAASNTQLIFRNVGGSAGDTLKLDDISVKEVILP